MYGLPFASCVIYNVLSFVPNQNCSEWNWICAFFMFYYTLRKHDHLTRQQQLWDDSVLKHV